MTESTVGRITRTDTGELLTVHPVAALFPMLNEEELDDLAEDIKANGLVHPIVLDTDGVLIDGRNRLEACRRAEVEPEFTTFRGRDPVRFILSANVARRDLTQGQKAMVTVRAIFQGNRPSLDDFLGRNGADKPHSSKLDEWGGKRELAAAIGVPRQRIFEALTIAEFAAEYVDAVISGGTPLSGALKVATDRKDKKDATPEKIERLRAGAPDLHKRVVEEGFDLDEAVLILDRRLALEEQKRDKARRTVAGMAAPIELGAMAASEWIADTAARLTHETSEDYPGLLRTKAALLMELAAAIEASGAEQ